MTKNRERFKPFTFDPTSHHITELDMSLNVRPSMIPTSLLLISMMSAPQVSTYDPLSATGKFGFVDQDWFDETRKRNVPIRIYHPTGKAKAPVIIFSHGLGGSRSNSPYLGEHWSKRGYVVVFPQHLGSDEAVWRGVPRTQIKAALTKAASGKNLQLRVQDIKFVIDELGRRNKDERYDLNKIGMSGHSFGAATTQAVSGQTIPVIGNEWNDTRIKAALAMSQVPAQDTTAFSKVKLPWFLMTGTKDDSIINTAKAADRLSVFNSLPSGDKFELILEGAEHMAFSEVIAFGQNKRNPNHHRAILAFSTAFWDYTLGKSSEAKAWLVPHRGKDILESKDTYRIK
jgi:predicted dienelactone hydrolase